MVPVVGLGAASPCLASIAKLSWLNWRRLQARLSCRPGAATAATHLSPSPSAAMAAACSASNSTRRTLASEARASACGARARACVCVIVCVFVCVCVCVCGWVFEGARVWDWGRASSDYPNAQAGCICRSPGCLLSTLSSLFFSFHQHSPDPLPHGPPPVHASGPLATPPPAQEVAGASDQGMQSSSPAI